MNVTVDDISIPNILKPSLYKECSCKFIFNLSIALQIYKIFFRSLIKSAVGSNACKDAQPTVEKDSIATKDRAGQLAFLLSKACLESDSNKYLRCGKDAYCEMPVCFKGGIAAPIQ